MELTKEQTREAMLELEVLIGTFDMNTLPFDLKQRLGHKLSSLRERVAELERERDAPKRKRFAYGVWMSDGFVLGYGARSLDGRFRFTMEVGEPGTDGFYNPIITRHNDPLPVFAENAALSSQLAALEPVVEAANAEWVHRHEPTRLSVADWADELERLEAALYDAVDAYRAAVADAMAEPTGDE